MEQLRLDARTKQEIKESIREYLYAHPERMSVRKLDSLVIKNCLACGYREQQFHYRGRLYVSSGARPVRSWNPLSNKLFDEMNSYLEEIQEYEMEEAYIMGSVTQILNSSNSIPDYFRVFPECLHPPIQRFLNSCPCKSKTLTDEQVQNLIHKNKLNIDQMQVRMITNLLI